MHSLDLLNRQLTDALAERQRRDHLSGERARLVADLGQADEKLTALRKALEAEGADVRALEGMSFTNLIVSLFGDKELRLSEERKELARAQLQFDEQSAECEAIRGEIDANEAKVKEIAPDLDSWIDRLRERKTRVLVETGAEPAARIQALDKRVESAGHEVQQLGESIDAGAEALAAIDLVFEDLRAASAWGGFDLIGGGVLSTAIKHSKLDGAKRHAIRAKRKLRQFERELADTGGEAAFEIEIGGFATFGDYFFDGLVFDWIVQSKIGDAKRRVDAQRVQVRELLEALQQRHDTTVRMLADAELERAAAIDAA